MTRSHAVVLSLALFFAATAPAFCQTTTVSVNSAVVTNATGVSVTSGQQLTITASGTVNIADRDGPYDANPDGTIITAPPNPSGAYTYFTNNAGPVGTPPAAGNKKTILSGGQLNNQPYAALVAGFSSSPTGSVSNYVLVGSSATITAPITGYLFLAVNDVNNTYDNNGSFSATITTTGQPIAAVEFTQATQQYQTLDQMKAYINSEIQTPVEMIAGRYAAMRIYFNPVQSATSYTVIASGPVSGTKTVQVPPNCQPQAQRGNLFPCTSTDFYFMVPVGVRDYTITVNDSTGKQLEQETFEMASANEQSIYLKGLWACSKPGVASSCQSPVGLIANTTLVAKLQPTITVSAFPSAQRVSKDLSLYPDPDDWLGAMVDAVERLYLPAAAAFESINGVFTDFVGVYDKDISSTGIAGFGGNNVMVPTSAPRLGVEGIPYTLAHEVGHTLKLDHTGVSNPAETNDMPPGCWGPGALTPGAPVTWPFPNNNIQSANGLEWGFDVASESVIDPSDTFDIMSYCMFRWASPPNFIRAFDRINNNFPVPTTGTERPQLIKAAANAATPRPLVQGAFWNVGGVIGASGVNFDPIFAENMQGFTDAGTGTYSIQLLNATGQTLFTRYFTPQLNVTETTGTDIVSNPQFSEWVPVTAGTATITILDPNGNTISSLPMAGTAPIVTITNPVAGFVGSGQQTVTWAIQSVAPTLTSRVYYSADNGTTWLQIEELTGTSDQLDFDTMQGTSTGLLRIDVSDGVNTGSATSVPFTVPRKTPSMIVITSPANGYTQAAANPLYLSGAAYDPDDGALTGSALQWSDNVQGVLGTGSPLTVSLQPGPHTITLTGTDSDGNAITSTVNVNMGGSGPSLSLATTTLSTNCVSATIAASPGDQGAALSQVGYSTDGGNSYTNIPLIALPYSFIVPGGSPVTVVAAARDLTQQTASQSAVVSLTGQCAAGIPFISSGSPQSAPLGSSFSTPLSVHISDAGGNPVAGAIVNFTAPASGASSTLSAASATTGANGVASVTATANSTSGAYQVVASVAGFSTTAQFNLTNTDFTLGVLNSSLTVHHGYAAFNTISVTPLLGFNSPVKLGCSGLLKGVTCTFSSPTVTPSGSTVYSSLTINAAGGASQSSATTLSALTGGVVVAFCLLVPGLRRRRKIFTAFLMIVLALVLGGVTSCAKFNVFSSTVTVTATSGALQHSGAIDLSVQ